MHTCPSFSACTSKCEEAITDLTTTGRTCTLPHITFASQCCSAESADTPISQEHLNLNVQHQPQNLANYSTGLRFIGGPEWVSISQSPQIPLPNIGMKSAAHYSGLAVPLPNTKLTQPYQENIGKEGREASCPSPCLPSTAFLLQHWSFFQTSRKIRACHGCPK